MEHETALINAFVVPAKRARLIEFLRSSKNRAKALDGLDHFGDLGMLLSCIPGRLGYFEGESPKDRFILARDGGT